tara:strand:+ start:190 stop:612 length:423 start_codon:yes stop_codon:yes gene_type:complete
MEKSCGVVLFNSDKFLLLQHNNEDSRADGHWDFPKGHVESGEEEIDTALRELKEETNIEDVNIIPSFKQFINYKIDKGTLSVSKRVIFFLAETKVWDVSLSSEHQNFIWLNFEEAIERLTYDNAKNILKKAHIFTSNMNV